MTRNKSINTPNTRLMAKVRAGFILNGNTTFHAYCIENDLDPSYAARAVKGTATGAGAKNLKVQVVQASKAKPAKPEQSMPA